MEIQEEQHGAVTVLRPVGPLAAADADQAKNRMEDALRISRGRVVLDAAAVPFLDSRGLEVLVEVGDEIAQTGQAMKICGENPTVRQALLLTGLSERFDHFEEVLAAVRSFL